MGADGAGGTARQAYGLAHIGDELVEGVACGGLGGPGGVDNRKHCRQNFSSRCGLLFSHRVLLQAAMLLLCARVNSFPPGRGAASTEKFLRADCGCLRDGRSVSVPVSALRATRNVPWAQPST